MKTGLLFPSWRYHRTEPPRRVLTADEVAALGPGWLEYPPLPGEPAEDDEETTARAQLHGLSVADVRIDLGDVTDPEVLERVRVREVANPKYPGGRAGVLRAIADRLAELGGAD